MQNSDMQNSENQVKILVVDDVPSKLVALAAILEDPGQSVIGVRSGREALRRLLQEDFAVILLDVNMPDIDGFETAALIRERKRTESTPIIFITADSDETHARRGYSLGAVDYILAPVIPEVLRTKVGVFVDLYRKTQQLKQQMDERVTLASEQAARAAAEQSTRRWEFLAEASHVLSRTLDHKATVTGLLRLLVPGVADCATLTLFNQPGRRSTHEFAWTDAGSGEFKQRRVDRHELPAKVVAAIEAASVARRTLKCGDLDMQQFVEWMRAVAADGTVEGNGHSAARSGEFPVFCVPLVPRGHTLGVITIGVDPSRREQLPEMPLVEDIAGRAAIALDNARLYREIQDGDQRKDEFLAMLGHELRNPLAAMANALECIEVLSDDPVTVNTAHDVLSRQLRQMSRLVDDLLDVSRITRGKVALRAETVELAAVIRRAVATITPAAEARGHELRVTLPADKIFLTADPTRLEQVLANLLHNAVKYTPPGGLIQLHAELDGEQLAIHVQDNGVGIAPDLLARIFDLFVQGDQTLDRSQGGLGIGLTLVRSLVELHGGQVSVVSGGVNEGSEFTVLLPGASRQAEEPAPAPPAPAIAPAVGRRILVVDDNVDLANTTAALLRAIGHEVWIANEGLGALELAALHHPDSVLIDIGLPGIDGYEIARRLRKDADFHNALLVALTGYGQEEDRRRSRAAGFDKHLVKPVSFADLQRAFASTASLETSKSAS
jgi:signal transduction histidine kinase/DNA-binding response OmpR family regulator